MWKKDYRVRDFGRGFLMLEKLFVIKIYMPRLWP